MEENLMKRNSKGYRLQLIKETVEKRERCMSDDPMARRIGHILAENPQHENERNMKQEFIGHHFDVHVDGWVSDKWK